MIGVYINEIACGETHTCAVSSNGDIYTWGGGQAGQLGHGDYLRQSLPIKVSNIKGQIKQVACGKRHTVILTEGGNIYSWGSNEYG